MILPLALAFVVLLLAAAPVSIAMGLASAFAILVTGKVPLNTVVTQMVAGMDSFPLMAIPFFILAGELMERGGISERLVALAKLVLGEPGARELVAKHPAVTIDGCKQMCASKMVRESGGTVAREVAVLDVFRRHKDLKPEGIAELNEAGRKLARVLAEEVAASLGARVKP